MPTTITLFNQKFTTTPKVKKQVQEYLSLIEDNYDTETATDLKASFAENLDNLSEGKDITKEIVDQVIAKIGVLEKPIYKSFYRYRGLFGGVCDGITTYFNISIWWPRLIFATPFITIALYILEFMSVYTISESLFYLGIPLIFIAPVNDGYTFSSLTENILNYSSWLILIYILAWLFIPKAITDFEVKQLKSKWEYSDELEKSIFNKVTFRTPVVRKLVTKLFLNIAKFGIFVFDMTLSIVNGISESSESLFTKFLKFLIVLTLILTILINLYIELKPA